MAQKDAFPHREVGGISAKLLKLAVSPAVMSSHCVVSPLQSQAAPPLIGLTPFSSLIVVCSVPPLFRAIRAFGFPARNASFLNFSYVCPEPVLVK